MLQKLFIQNYAIIDELEIEFDAHLNIITGETGAGKSILMGALNLILGERAESTILFNSNKKCIVEGFFKVGDNEALKNAIQSAELEDDEFLIIRREIGTNGKSRAFINDTPVTLQVLKQITSLLVDLHQQFDTLEITNSDFQRVVIDAVAQNQSVLHQYQLLYTDWSTEQKKLASLLEQKNNFQKEADYHQFLFNELAEADFKTDELEQLEQELQLLSNSEGIKQALNAGYYHLQEQENAIVSQLKSIIQQLTAFEELHPKVKEVVSRIHSSYIELGDIAQEIDHLNQEINFDAERLAWIQERLNLGYKLQKKHSVNSTNELLQIQSSLEQKLQAVLEIDDAINNTKTSIELLLQQIQKLAAQLSKQRKQVAPMVQEQINQLLSQVGMPNAKIQINIQSIDYTATGADSIEFLFDANKTGKFESIKKVASGGELSRLMLCIKSLVADKINLPTMIFDEIDSGISGEAAKQVGIIMQGMAQQRQIICITHQPQIAGKANTHFYVYKAIVNNSIQTQIKLLNNDERIIAIAKMLSGEDPSAAAIASAKEMMN